MQRAHTCCLGGGRWRTARAVKVGPAGGTVVAVGGALPRQVQLLLPRGVDARGGAVATHRDAARQQEHDAKDGDGDGVGGDGGRGK